MAAIDVLVPVVPGGVKAYGCVIQETLSSTSRLVQLSKSNEPLWRPDGGSTVFLQYSGYGFAKRGAPLWLIRALRIRRAEIKTLGVYFHELYAFGPPWTSSFWLSPVQQYVCWRLSRMADFWITNRAASASWLTAAAGRKAHAVLPVFSNLGEPRGAMPAKRPWVVVCGSPGLRAATYKAAGKRLFEWASDLTLEVHDVGQTPADPDVRRLLDAHRVARHGHLDDGAASRMLEQARFAILAYPVAFAAKSSVFAAFCAHAVCTVLISDRHENLDGLVPEKHYLTEIPRTLAEAKAHGIGNEARAWYGSHSIAVHASTLTALVEQVRASATR